MDSCNNPSSFVAIDDDSCDLFMIIEFLFARHVIKVLFHNYGSATTIVLILLLIRFGHFIFFADLHVFLCYHHSLVFINSCFQNDRTVLVL